MTFNDKSTFDIRLHVAFIPGLRIVNNKTEAYLARNIYELSTNRMLSRDYFTKWKTRYLNSNKILVWTTFLKMQRIVLRFYRLVITLHRLAPSYVV